MGDHPLKNFAGGWKDENGQGYYVPGLHNGIDAR
jgi:hypothetical protein